MVERWSQYSSLIGWLQVPLLPELAMLADDVNAFDQMYKEDPRQDAEALEAYKYAFRYTVNLITTQFL